MSEIDLSRQIIDILQPIFKLTAKKFYGTNGEKSISENEIRGGQGPLGAPFDFWGKGEKIHWTSWHLSGWSSAFKTIGLVFLRILNQRNISPPWFFSQYFWFWKQWQTFCYSDCHERSSKVFWIQELAIRQFSLHPNSADGDGDVNCNLSFLDPNFSHSSFVL